MNIVGKTHICLNILQRLTKCRYLEDVHCGAHSKTAPGDALPLELNIVLAHNVSWSLDCGGHDLLPGIQLLKLADTLLIKTSMQNSSKQMR